MAWTIKLQLPKGSTAATPSPLAGLGDDKACPMQALRHPEPHLTPQVDGIPLDTKTKPFVSAPCPTLELAQTLHL